MESLKAYALRVLRCLPATINLKGPLLIPGELGALPASLQEVIRSFEVVPLVVSVPRHSPMTREQFAEWNEHWPLTYHESAVQHALRCGPAGPRHACRARH